jgi:chaperonin GroES
VLEWKYKNEEEHMSTPIKPLGARVVATKEEAKTKTASGIYLPDTAKEQPAHAIAVAVGPEVKGIKNGDKIIYKQYSATELKVDGKEYLIVNEEDVLATV